MGKVDNAGNLKNKYINLKRELFDIKYSFLNEPQRQAVYTHDGPLLILAGAGSGKTTVLVNRIAFLIRYGDAYFNYDVPDINENEIETLESIVEFYREYYNNKSEDMADISAELDDMLAQFIYNPCPAYAILSITFTNKAANEMKKRLSNILGETADDIWAGTFHSICVRILRRYIDRLGLGYSSNFTIYDMDDVKRQVADTMKTLNIDEKALSVRTVMTVISRHKDRLKYPQDMGEPVDVRETRIKKIYQAYQESLRASNAVDFDDIIALTVKLLQTDSEVREYYSGRFKYILVDEYQDTNYAQYILITLLSEKYNNIMVVGDDDQSIYKFRGATIENILSFATRFRDAQVIKLEQNYRSTKNILNAANEIIKNNAGRMGKSLWTDRPEGQIVVIKENYNQVDEANYIIDKIMDLVIDEKRKYKDFAVLYRVNAQAASLELAFAKSAIPYRTFGSIRFYDRKEIKDMVAYFRVINNPADAVSLKRIINEPKRGIGDTTISTIEQIALSENKTMLEVIQNADKYPALGRSMNKLKNFAILIKTFITLATTDTLPEFFEKVFDNSGYRTMLEVAGEEEADRLDNVKELISQAISYTEKCENEGEDATLSGFLEEVALVSDIDNYDADANAVTLMTIHSSKGLEFPVVFLPGMEENVFPSLQAVQASFTDSEPLEEERRLAYVAVTRAKDVLVLAYVKDRLLYGRSGFNAVSRFVNEIPEGMAEHIKLGSGEQRQRTTAFTSTKKYPPRVPQNSEFSTKYTTASTEAGEKVQETMQKYKKGDVVEHTNFGIGLVINVIDMTGDILYEIAFDTAGTKKMMGTYTYKKLKLIK